MGARSSFPVEELLCPVCNKIFKNPVLLNCSHNICKSCWEKFCKENKSWECPVCRRSSSMNPPFNLALNRLCEVCTNEKMLKAPAFSRAQENPLRQSAPSAVLKRKARYPASPGQRNSAQITSATGENERSKTTLIWSDIPKKTERASVEHFIQESQRASAASEIQEWSQRASTVSGQQERSQTASAASEIQESRGASAASEIQESRGASAASEIQESQGASAGSEVFCSLHREKLKLFCLTDKQPICVLCRDSNKHKSHDCVPIDEAVPDLKNELQTVLKPFNAKLEVFKKVKQTLDQTAEHINNQVKHTEQKINQDFEEIYHFLQNEKAARIAALRREEEQKSKMMKEKIEEMSTNISSLSDTIRAIEKELKAEDIPFLQNFKATKKRSQCTLPDPQLVSGSLIDVAEHLGNLQFRVWEKMRGIVKYTPVILDPNTAHPSLYLSEDLTSVRRPGTWQLLPDNPERFMKYPDVLGIEGFSSGNHSWQVEVGAHPQWFLGVATENKDRNGTLGVSPKDGIWCIILDCGKYRAGGGMGITLKRRPQEIRVALDYERGEVSFHDPKDMTLIYTHKDRFTEKLFPYLNIGRAAGDNQTGIKICQSELSVTVM